MCRIIWQCTLTPPQPSTAAMAGRLNIPAADAHPPVTSSVQLSSSPAQSGRRSRGIYPETQEKMIIHAQIEIIFFVPSVTASGSARESGEKSAAGTENSVPLSRGINLVSKPSVSLRESATKNYNSRPGAPEHTRAHTAYNERGTGVDAEQGHPLRVGLRDSPLFEKRGGHSCAHGVARDKAHARRRARAPREIE